MKWRTLLTLATVGIVLSTGLTVAGGAVIDRIGAGGLWSDTTKWDPNQLPGSADTANHGADANDVTTFDSNVPMANREIANLTVVPGSSRGLLIDDNQDLTVTGNVTRSGAGTYEIELDPGSSLTVDGTLSEVNVTVGSGAAVEAGDIALAQGTSWSVDDGSVDVLGDITFSGTTSGGFQLDNDAILTVGGSATIFGLGMDTGATADIDGTLTVASTSLDASTLTAGSIDCNGTQFHFRDDCTVVVDGEFLVESDCELGYQVTPNGSGNTLDVGSLNFAASDSTFFGLAADSLDLTVRGDLDVQTTQMARFRPMNVSLTFDADGELDFEVFSTDYDVPSVGNVWLGVHKSGAAVYYNASWFADLTVTDGTTVNITDAVENANREGYSQDALYIRGNVIVESGATLNLGDIVLYYTGTLTNNGTINGTTQSSTVRCYGDFDGDGDVDLDDYGDFSQHYFGSSTPTDDALFDGNFDGYVDAADYALFSANFTGANNPCPE